MTKRRKLALITSVILLLTSILTLPTFAAAPTTGASYINFANTEVFENAEGFFDGDKIVRSYLSDDKQEIVFCSNDFTESNFIIEFPNIKLKDLLPNATEAQIYYITFECNVNARISMYLKNTGTYIGGCENGTREPMMLDYLSSYGEETIQIEIMPENDDIAYYKQFSIKFFYATQNTTNTSLLKNYLENLWTPYDAGYFNSNSAEYSQGYSNGYKDGYSQGNKDGYMEGNEAGFELGKSKAEERYEEGYNKGYKIGFSLGKEEGLQITKTGDWTQLITAVVEAPVNTFQSLFNFEILGLDMRLAFGSILALCVLVIIIKKTVL